MVYYGRRPTAFTPEDKIVILDRGLWLRLRLRSNEALAVYGTSMAHQVGL